MADLDLLCPTERFCQVVQTEGYRGLCAIQQFAWDALSRRNPVGAYHVGFLAADGGDGISVCAESIQVEADDFVRHQGAHGLVGQDGRVLFPQFCMQACDTVSQGVDTGVSGREQRVKLANSAVSGRSFYKFVPFRIANHVDAVDFGMALKGLQGVGDDRLACNLHELFGAVGVHAEAMSSG